MAPTAIQEPTQSTTDRNTGFPEPLSTDRNTTLPHPEADTSKGATIEAPEVLHLTHSRNRSFLGRHHSSNHQSHKNALILDESGLYEDIQYADGTKEKRSSKEIERDVRSENPGGRVGEVNGKGVVNGYGLGKEGVDGVDGAGEEKDEFGYREGERRKGVLRKLKLHKV